MHFFFKKNRILTYPIYLFILDKKTLEKSKASIYSKKNLNYSAAASKSASLSADTTSPSSLDFSLSAFL